MALAYTSTIRSAADIGAALARLYPTGDRPTLTYTDGAYALSGPGAPYPNDAAIEQAIAANAADAPKRQAAQTLAATDAKMARVAEDVIDALKAKGLIADADLPSEARALVAQRKAARSTIAGGGGA